MRLERRTTKDGLDRWRCVIRRQGFTTKSATFTNRRDAERWGIETERGMLRQRAGMSAPVTQASFAALVDRFLGSSHASADAKSRNRRAHLRWWCDRIGTMPAAAVRPRDIRTALDALDVAPSTRNRYMTSIRSVYRWALELELVTADPCASLRRSREGAHVIRWLTDVEREALIRACRAEGDTILLGQVLVSLWTGGRRSEVLGLRWRDIDRESGLIHYPATKGGRPRAVPAPPEVFELLNCATWQSERERLTPDFLVFSHWPRRAWRRALKHSGVQRFRWHDLRHSCASWLVQRGVPIADVQQLLGHRAIATTLRYAHLAPSDAHHRVRAAYAQRDDATHRRVLSWTPRA